MELVKQSAKKSSALETEDPIAAFAKKDADKESTEQKFKRLVTIAIDAGHGGEDPGAIGKRAPKKKMLYCRLPGV